MKRKGRRENNNNYFCFLCPEKGVDASAVFTLSSFVLPVCCLVKISLFFYQSEVLICLVKDVRLVDVRLGIAKTGFAILR